MRNILLDEELNTGKQTDSGFIQSLLERLVGIKDEL